ncbi:MAG: cytochrome c biogenesis protein ResB [Verrucomicrobiota bacterium]
MLFKRIFNFFSSLRLTVACLACALVLVFAGTLAQIHLGLYVTQERYFHSLFVSWTVPGTEFRIPVWPGGYLLGGVLLINLLAAYSKRLSFSARKLGLFMIHGGLILLLLGQFLTETFQIETFMQLEEGETKNYTEHARKSELAITDTSDAKRDEVTVVPEALLAAKGDIQVPALPFTVRVKEYFPNSAPAPAMQSVAGAMQRVEASRGVGQRLRFQPRDLTVRPDEENVPLALVEIVTPEGSLGTWTVSNWLTKYPYPAGQLRQMLGAQATSLLDVPQEFSYKGKTYKLAVRPVRYYKPYSITLLDFTHKRYKGTEIPKDFSSSIRLQNPATGENREVRIFMNNPLRYAGETYYQGGFLPGDTVSILQVVRNPAWLTPYFSCALVGLGLTVQFLMHLVSFGKRRAQKPLSGETRGRKVKGSRERRESPEAAVAAGEAMVKSMQVAAGKRRSS